MTAILNTVLKVLLVGAPVDMNACKSALSSHDIVEMKTAEDVRQWCLDQRPDCVIASTDEKILRDICGDCVPLLILSEEEKASPAFLPRVVAQAVDIARLKIEMKETLEKADDFTHTIAHDFKAPLRHIMSYCSFLKEDYEAKLDDEGKKFLERLSTAAQRLHKMVDDLRDASAKKTTED